MRRNSLKDINDKALANSTVDPVTGCYIYNRYVDKDGYPNIKYKGRTRRMSRMLWYYFHKEEVPKDLVIMHTCDNPKCVNIDHLRLGTYMDNNRDRDAKGRRGYRQKTIDLERMFSLLEHNDQRTTARIMGYSEAYISILLKRLR